MTLNILEYLASNFTVEFELIDTDHPFPVLATRLDSTTADSWMIKSNFDPDCKIHTACGRHLGGLLIAADACLSSYWIMGELNPVADSLSRDHHLSYKQLAYLYASLYPSQMPNCFRFLCLTPAMILFMTSLVQDSTVR